MVDDTDCRCLARIQDFMVIGQNKRLSVVSLEFQETVGYIDCGGHVTSVLAVGNYLWIGQDSGAIDVWHFSDGSVSLFKSMRVHGGLVDTLVLMPNDRYVVSTSLDNAVIVWDARVCLSAAACRRESVVSDPSHARLLFSLCC